MFQFPKIHSFPPFYTKQSNATILENQLNEWCTVVLLYCQYHKIYILSPQGAVLSKQNDGEPVEGLFENSDIERRVSPDFCRDILHHLIHKVKRATYVNSKNQDAGVLILWRTLEEWAELLRDHVEKTGQLGSILTVYELTKLEDSAIHEELRNIDSTLFVRILQVLTKQGKAQIIKSEDNPAEIGGVKIV
ncbi:ESCRT-II complex, vps25 subunit [Metschnikowia bicuspidata var. bicuspidata NRRL YB-4993]|uniref:ESCRT-II complex, vps25 subunit n=1 Tax=Metschnikowia bicuspidata var. bicuspidata NRRL YB-4993 TaxID=869754 RepID=A0A1A0HHA3_9ASCO|nr:ESCRT-II complex, vps25 subunit [Metschnikowia bicuspidata var. bicuspidata NRRL YB-4993]OBA23257.1 ESCRT-II complex, vps25 subunit [Metschnikowia bicuspidata var. bicuspidata NRRL YB-4993]